MKKNAAKILGTCQQKERKSYGAWLLEHVNKRKKLWNLTLGTCQQKGTAKELDSWNMPTEGQSYGTWVLEHVNRRAKLWNLTLGHVNRRAQLWNLTLWTCQQKGKTMELDSWNMSTEGQSYGIWQPPKNSTEKKNSEQNDQVPVKRTGWPSSTEINGKVIITKDSTEYRNMIGKAYMHLMENMNWALKPVYKLRVPHVQEFFVYSFLVRKSRDSETPVNPLVKVLSLISLGLVKGNKRHTLISLRHL